MAYLSANCRMFELSQFFIRFVGRNRHENNQAGIAVEVVGTCNIYVTFSSRAAACQNVVFNNEGKWHANDSHSFVRFHDSSFLIKFCISILLFQEVIFTNQLATRYGILLTATENEQLRQRIPRLLWTQCLQQSRAAGRSQVPIRRIEHFHHHW